MTQAGSSWEDAVRWLRAQPDQAELVSDAYYDDPLDAAADRYWRSNEWKAVRDLIGVGPARALDVGAGRGIASYALVKDGYSVTALEPDPSALVGAAAIRELAETHKLDITVTGELSERLPFADAAFDVIVARAVLHHIADLPAALRELFRVLRPGGKLLAMREHVISREEHRDAFLNRHPLHHRYGGENALRLSSYLSALEQAGFHLIKVLAPFDSAINYGPRSLKDQFASVLSLPLFPDAAALMLRLPGVGALARAGLSLIDRRPGRHYSFLAIHPPQ